MFSTFTGTLRWPEQVWLGVLHAGGSALVGGLSPLEWHGLKNWHRDEITVLVDDELSFDPIPGIRYFRTRRPLSAMAAPLALPIAAPEPAALLFAAMSVPHEPPRGSWPPSFNSASVLRRTCSTSSS
ncbi:MAG TPA: hypothetical protein VHZ06_06285 [Marmoricola sp.]|nr:hypothetical protein [Marmoricola sp.]